MSARQGHTLASRAALFMALLLGACRVTAPGALKAEVEGVERPPLLDTRPLAARCEASRCDAFCESASCLFASRDACLEVCRVRCGDAYFEPADLELVGCVEARPGCEAAKVCCAQHFTSHLCAD